VERWATFDCYGTLIDWNAGIGEQLEHVFGAGDRDRLLARYHELEPEVQAEEFRPYGTVLTLTFERLLAEEGMQLPEGEAGSLARSLPDWPFFPEVPAALEELRRRGWLLAILSNSDRDLIAASQRRIGVPFDLTVVAEEIGSYKPAHRHWEAFHDRSAARPERHVHVAASLFHDIAPAAALGIPSVWINRLGEPDDDRPARTLSDLSALPDVLDELLPA
jgi:2-haloacid dehalogenase